MMLRSVWTRFLEKRAREKTYGTLKNIQGTKLWFFLVVLAFGPPVGLYEQCYWGIFADLLAF